MSSDDKHIIDTVVLLYFLLVGEEELLRTLLGTPLQVPLAVYDPEDRNLPPAAHRRAELLSEMRQVVGHYESSARLTGDADSLSRVRRIDSLYDERGLVPVPMTPDERLLAAKLESAEALQYGVRVPLGPGEAACVAISFERGWTIATDDSDALKVLKKLHRGQDFHYERIRKLLIRAADEGHVTREEANHSTPLCAPRGSGTPGSPSDKGARTHLDEAFAEHFGGPLPDVVNAEQQFTILASELDPTSDRIIEFLAESYDAPINAVFFRHLADGGLAYLARTWLLDPQHVEDKAARPSRRKLRPWNGRDFSVGQRTRRTPGQSRRRRQSETPCPTPGMGGQGLGILRGA